MRHHYRVIIAYKGSPYCGWQAQSANADDGGRSPSVQGTIREILRRMCRYPDEGECTISGTSRTDAGVHALGQLGKISIPRDLDPAVLLRGLNTLLPESIRVLECCRSEPEFNPKASGSNKEYHYYFSSAAVANPLISDVVAHVPGPLDVGIMMQAAQLFVGEHDFFNYCRRAAQAATTVRIIRSCEIVTEASGPVLCDAYSLRVVGTGFLKNMVRYIAGTLFEVGRGGLTLAEVRSSLEVHREEKHCAKAAAKGLHLVAITGL